MSFLCLPNILSVPVTLVLPLIPSTLFSFLLSLLDCLSISPSFYSKHWWSKQEKCGAREGVWHATKRCCGCVACTVTIRTTECFLTPYLSLSLFSLSSFFSFPPYITMSWSFISLLSSEDTVLLWTVAWEIMKLHTVFEPTTSALLKKPSTITSGAITTSHFESVICSGLRTGTISVQWTCLYIFEAKPYNHANLAQGLAKCGRMRKKTGVKTSLSWCLPILLHAATSFIFPEDTTGTFLGN